MRKDAEAIANSLTTAAKSIVGSTNADMERLVGWVLDSTKTNWRAMLKQQKEHPKWITHGSHVTWPLCAWHCAFDEVLFQVKARYWTRYWTGQQPDTLA
jgi:hypothetical protein